MTEIIEIHEPDRKSAVCDSILRALPAWFGIEASIVEYVEDVKVMPLYAALDGDKPVGFEAVKVHNAYTAEVCVMGVLKEYHRSGIGRQLIVRCEQFCRENGMEFLTVKTLDGSAKSESYERTRHFYYSMGFRPLEVFPLLWDEANPCLFLAKYIGSGL